MPPATGPALIILVAFALPGFVTVLLQERTFKSADDPTPLDRLLRRDYHDYTSEPAQLVWRGVLVVVRCYVRVTLSNGGRVLGLYDRASFASYSKDGRDLFLERVFALTGTTRAGSVPKSKGISQVFYSGPAGT